VFVKEHMTDTEPKINALGKVPDSVQLLTNKNAELSSLQAALTNTPTITSTVRGPTKTVADVSIILPLPWSWAAAILAHPEWTIQTTTR
jgi:hypothetical protein